MKNSIATLTGLAVDLADQYGEDFKSFEVLGNSVNLTTNENVHTFNSEDEFLKEYESCFDMTCWGPPGVTDITTIIDGYTD